MESRFYSVEELSEILDLHPKTVQRFIREGKIRGRKIGRSWKVNHKDLRDFAHAELSTETISENRTGYAEPGAKDRITVSTVVEIHEKDPDEASRISNSLMAMLNCKDPSWGQCDFRVMQFPESGTARFIVNGTPRFIAEIMSFFEVIAGQEN